MGAQDQSAPGKKQSITNEGSGRSRRLCLLASSMELVEALKTMIRVKKSDHSNHRHHSNHHVLQQLQPVEQEQYQPYNEITQFAVSAVQHR